MHIAVYYPWVYLTSGVERVILETYRRSKHEHTIFTNYFEKDNTYPEFKYLNVIALPQISVKRTIQSVLRAAMTIAVQRVSFDSFDALIVHCDGLGDLILARSLKIPSVCFCHTPLRAVFDGYYRQRVLDRYTGVTRLAFYVFSACFKAVDRRLWACYQHVFFNSQETFKRAERGGLLRHMNGKCEVPSPWN